MLPLLLLALTPPADTWAGFRNDGTSRTAASLPLTWSPDTVAWRVPTPGYGQSAPVVWKGTVYLTGVEGPNKETLHVSAFALADAKQLWSKAFPSSQPGKNNPMMSRAAGTPVVDAAGPVCLFESGDLIALTHTGAVRWQRPLGTEFGPLKNNHGLGSSPTQTAEHVVVLLDHQGPGKLLAISKADGTTAWAADRPARSSWTSPVVVDAAGRPQVVVSSGGTVTGYDAATGSQLWELPGLVGNSIPSPTPAGDRVVVAAGENRMKPDADATSRSNLCLRLTGDTPPFEVVWRAKKLAAGTASPLVHNGLVYFCDKGGFVAALDAATGEERFRERLPGEVWATPVGAGDRVYFFGKDGVTTVWRAGPAFDPLANNRFWSADDYAARAKAAREQAATLPKPPEGRGPAGGPPVPKAELEAARYSAVGDVVYGVAAVDGAFVVRTGTELLRVGPGL